MSGYFRGLVTRNWGLKIAAFVLALVVWLVLVPQDKMLSEKTLSVPLETTNIPDNLEIVSPLMPTVDITVRATARVLGQLQPAGLAVRIDLGRASVYQQEYPLNKSMVSLPPGAEVVEIKPSKVAIKLEKTAEETLDISPSIRGKVASGYRISRVEVQPSQVLVRGPESKIRSKDVVTTAPIDVSGLAESTVFDADIILPKPELRLISPQTSARVTVVVEDTRGGAAKKKQS